MSVERSAIISRPRGHMAVRNVGCGLRREEGSMVLRRDLELVTSNEQEATIGGTCPGKKVLRNLMELISGSGSVVSLAGPYMTGCL